MVRLGMEWLVVTEVCYEECVLLQCSFLLRGWPWGRFFARSSWQWCDLGSVLLLGLTGDGCQFDGGRIAP